MHRQLSGSRSSSTTPPSLAENSVRLAGHVHDVGVLEHRPVAGLVGHVLPVDGLGAAQLLEERVGRPVDVRVG